ncbi:MAG: protein kinase domain-containing protein, partial [Chloroflexota bacterium]
PDPVVFRDLKPANVLVRPSGAEPACRLAVVDFGIARRFQSDTVGTVIGTPGYAPPEQYQGLATPQSDIYALGATLHRALTGYDPTHPNPNQPLFSFPAADELNPNLSTRMAEVLARAVALAPSDRYANAAEFRAALQGLSARRFIATPFGTRSAPSSRRGLAVMAAVLLVPLMLSQVFRLAQLPLENGYYATGSSAAQPGAAQPALGPYAPTPRCAPPSQVTAAQTGGTVCGPDGTEWHLNVAGSEIVHSELNGDRAVFTLGNGEMPVGATLVSPSLKASHCNCVWLVDDSGLRIRLNANGDSARVPLPATILPKLSSGLLQH